jgi:hypothetical protein
MATVVVKVVVAIVVALGKAAMIGPIAVAMVAVAIEGLGVATADVTLRPRVIEVSASVGPGTTTVVGESARTARAAA